MTTTTKLLVLVSVLGAACDGADAPPPHHVLQRSQQGAFEFMEVRAGTETHTVIVHLEQPPAALVPTADAGVVETAAGPVYFDSRGAVNADDIDDPVAVALLDAAIAGELASEEPTFRLDADEFAEGAIHQAAWMACVSSCDAQYGEGTNMSFFCTMCC